MDAGVFLYFCSPIMENMILSTKALCIGYGHAVVQQALNLSIDLGQLVCVLGTNGCGKSTLFRTLTGLQKSLGGSTEINGKNVLEMSDTERAKTFSIVLTDKVDMENTTVFDIVALGRYPYSTWLGSLSREDKQAITAAIDMVELTDKTHNFFTQLSDGEKQRVMIAKALAQDTPLIFLDEPTAHLDLPNRVKIMLLLRRLAHKTNKAILLSTHELDLAIQAADKIWLMKVQGGVCCGTPDELVQQGVFQQTFQTDSFVFSQVDGRLVMRYKL